MGFDLNKKNLSEIAEAGYEFELRIPKSNEKTGAFVTVRGDQSKIVKAHIRKKFDEIQVREANNKRKGKAGEVPPMTLEEYEEDAIKEAVVRIISWKGIEEDGKPVPFTKENAVRILSEHSWIREQIQEEASEQLNFLG